MSATSSRVSSTQNLFKPNPNFVNTNKNKLTQQNASSKRLPSHDAAAATTAIVKEKQFSMISGDVNDNDSGML